MLVYTVLAIGLLVVLCPDAYAQTAGGSGNAIQAAITGLLNFLQGTVGRSICILAIFVGFVVGMFAPHYSRQGWTAFALGMFAFSAGWLVSLYG